MTETENETKTAPAPGVPKDAGVSTTTYVVLVEEKTHNESPLSWHPLAHIEARSSEQAIRKAVEGKTVPMVLVAVPARSWNPVKVTPKVETTLVIEDVKA